MFPVIPAMLKPADHIYTPSTGGLISHHGIYVGEAKVINPINGEESMIDDAVIHLVVVGKKVKKGKSSHEARCSKCFHAPYHGGIVLTCLDCFCDGALLYVYEYNADPTWAMLGKGSVSKSLPPDQVIQRAYRLLHGEEDFGEYNLILNNCEHFATYCKSGDRKCNQKSFVSTTPLCTIC